MNEPWNCNQPRCNAPASTTSNAMPQSPDHALVVLFVRLVCLSRLSVCLLPSAQLLQQVQRLRTAADAASPAGSAAGGSGHSSDAAACVLAPPPPLEAPHIVSCRTLSGQPGVDERAASALDISAMACELLAQGYMVQVRESSGAQQQERSKTPRSCLQSLRHKFIVCLGVRSDDDEVVYLPQPLVVEPRLRETFAIAHSTPQYEALLQVCVLVGGWGLGGVGSVWGVGADSP